MSTTPANPAAPQGEQTQPPPPPPSLDHQGPGADQDQGPGNAQNSGAGLGVDAPAPGNGEVESRPTMRQTPPLSDIGARLSLRFNNYACNIIISVVIHEVECGEKRKYKVIYFRHNYHGLNMNTYTLRKLKPVPSSGLSPLFCTLNRLTCHTVVQATRLCLGRSGGHYRSCNRGRILENVQEG